MLALRTYNHLSSTPVNALLNEWSRMWPTPETVVRTQSPTRPRLACREHEDRHEIFAALPGLKKTELSIEVSEQVLILRRVTPAESQDNQGESSDRTTPFAISKGFEQRIALPKDGDLSKVSAHLEAGILTITVPKQTPPEPLAVSITGE